VADRYFTPEEANALLPEVRLLVEQMVSHRRALARATVRHSQIAMKIAGNGGGVDPHEIDQLQERIDAQAGAVVEAVETLQRLGIQVKDLDEGLIDFPALRGTEEVLLCWRLGEDEIAYWHTAEGGFAGRRPLPLE
jgi:hypothetical protein